MIRVLLCATTVIAAVALAIGCGVTAKEPAGEERGDCLPDGTCNEGLTCASGVCVRLDDAGGADGGEPQDKGVPVKDAGTDAADRETGPSDVSETPDGSTLDAGGDPAMPDGGATPKICPEPVSVDFGTMFVGQTKTQTVVFRSCGTAPVSLLGVELAAASGNWFALGVVSPSLPATLEPGAEVRVAAACTPAGTGSQQGQLDVFTNDPSLPDGKGYIRLLCQAKEQPGCKLKADPAAIDFGKLAPNVVSYKEFHLLNVGESACAVSAIMGPASPEFEIAGIADDQGTALAGAPFTIDPTRRVNVSVRFTAPFTKTCLGDGITFDNSSVNAPNLSVSLAGCGGEAPNCKFNVQPPDTLDFGNVTKDSNKTVAVNLENAGTDTCQINQAKLGAMSGEWFSIPAGYVFPIAVQPGSSTKIEVMCSP
ncbi:MAG: choice-of-anchor D domain-containing protein [Deltaproteobacteria bacterium]|nr:choice-of-anchor D domain-containing protein [Deltaproteobacteria bacterium]